MPQETNDSRGQDGTETFRHHYSEPALWEKVGAMPATASRAVVEVAVTLWVVLTHRETPAWARMLVIGALGYFICPVDAIPDGIPVAGYVDDLAVMLAVLAKLDAMVTPAMRARVRRLLPWSGGGAGIERIGGSTEGNERNET